MFSINPRTGTLTFSNIVAALRASINATSCGVVTMIAPERATVWTIEHQIIELAPFYLPEELLCVTRDHRPAQDRRGGIVEQKTHRHQTQSILVNWHDLVLFRSHRAFSGAKHE